MRSAAAPGLAPGRRHQRSGELTCVGGGAEPGRLSHLCPERDVGGTCLRVSLLDKEMRAFDNMRDRFRHAARYGRLSARDRNSELGQYFLHANPYKQEEVRKEYKGTLRDMWSAWVAAQPVGRWAARSPWKNVS